MSIPVKIIIGLSSYAFQKFLDRYGEEIIAYASRRGEELVREYGPQVVHWTADRGNDFYSSLAPRATGALSRISAVSGRAAKGAVVAAADAGESGRLSTLLFGTVLPETLALIGAYVRAAAELGAGQLRNVSDEQIGAIAVALWRSQNRDGYLGRRLRKTFWRAK